MAALNLITGYGSDSSDCSEENPPAHPSQQESNPKNFFSAEDVSSSGEEDVGSFQTSSVFPTENLKNPFRAVDVGTPTKQEKPSVFANPFKDAEDAVKCTLEQHVKFAPRLEDVSEINGRKICWNYRKGRCRFGTQCVFAHDCELIDKKAAQPVSMENVNLTDSPETISTIINEPRKSVKRPGLSQGIVPGKKVLKKYHEQKRHDNH